MFPPFHFIGKIPLETKHKNKHQFTDTTQFSRLQNCRMC